jgi:hypothetical protein
MKTKPKSSSHHLAFLMITIATLSLYPFEDCYSQSYWDKIRRTSVGIQGAHYDMDAGIAIQVTTPLFFSESFSLRFTGAVQWLETYYQKRLDLMPYHSMRTGLVYNLPMMERSRVYFEVGSYMIFPNKTFSNKEVVNGGYGVIGAEFFFYQHPRVVVSYFAEMGFTALDTKAERLQDERSYSNGLLVTTGFRFYPFGQKTSVGE